MILNPYPDYKDSGSRWLGNVPKHWSVLPNRAIFRERKERGYQDEQLISVTISRGVIRQVDLLADSSKKDSSNLDKTKYKLVMPGDIAYNKMRAWQGAIGVSDYRGIISPAYIVVTPRRPHSAGYFHYLFRTPAFAKEAERWSYGITSDQWSLRPEHFKLIYSCVPPEEEQSAILRYVRHFEQRIRQYIRAKQKVINLIKGWQKAIIHRGLDLDLVRNQNNQSSNLSAEDLPALWEAKRLKWVTRLQRGYDLPSERRKSGPFPVVSSGGIIGRHEEYKAEAPGIVIGRYGSTDAVFYLNEPFWPHNTALFVTDFQGNDPRWSFYLLRGISKEDHATKSAVPGLDRKDLYQIYVPVPPPEVQVQLAASLDRQLAALEDAIRRLLGQVGNIQDYRNRLIADVVTGKLDVRQSAANLLDHEQETEAEEPDSLEDGQEEASAEHPEEALGDITHA